MQVRAQAQETAALDIRTLQTLLEGATCFHVIRPNDYQDLSPETVARSLLLGAIETLLGPQILLAPCTAKVSVAMLTGQMRTDLKLEEPLAVQLSDLQYEQLAGTYSDNYCEWHKDHAWTFGAADGSLTGDELADMLSTAFGRVWTSTQGWTSSRLVELETKVCIPSLQCNCTFFDPTRFPANNLRELVTVVATNIEYELYSFSRVQDLNMTEAAMRDLLIDYGVPHRGEDHAALAALLLPVEQLRAAEMAGRVSIGTLDVVNNRSDCCGGKPMRVVCADRSHSSKEPKAFIEVNQVHSFGRHKGFLISIDHSKLVLDWGLFQRLMVFSMASVGAMSLVPDGALTDIQRALDGVVLHEEPRVREEQLLTYIRTAAGGTVATLQCASMVCECLPDFSSAVATEAVEVGLCIVYDLWMYLDVMKQKANLSHVSLRPIFIKEDLHKIYPEAQEEGKKRDADIIPSMHIQFEMLTQSGLPRSKIDIMNPDIQVWSRVSLGLVHERVCMRSLWHMVDGSYHLRALLTILRAGGTAPWPRPGAPVCSCTPRCRPQHRVSLTVHAPSSHARWHGEGVCILGILHPASTS
jgi:hypothetical protein